MWTVTVISKPLRREICVFSYILLFTFGSLKFLIGMATGYFDSDFNSPGPETRKHSSGCSLARKTYMSKEHYPPTRPHLNKLLKLPILSLINSGKPSPGKCFSFQLSSFWLWLFSVLSSRSWTHILADMSHLWALSSTEVMLENHPIQLPIKKITKKENFVMF